MTNYLDKLVHVSAYTKDDGTHVKEYWRGRGPSGIAPEDNNEDGFIMDETFKSRLPFKSPDIVMNEAGGETVLHGRVETTVGGSLSEVLSDLGEGLGEIIGIAVEVGIQATKIAGKMYLEVQKLNNPGNLEQYKEQLDASIHNMDLTQNALKTTIDKNVNKLVNTKDQNKYSKLYDSYLKQDELYNKNNQTVFDELKNYQSNHQEVIAKNESGNLSGSQAQELRSLPNDSGNLWNTPYMKPTGNTSPFGDGALREYNAYANRNAPDAKQLMDISLIDPKNLTPSPDYEVLLATLNQQTAKDLGVNIPSNWLGVKFSEDSSISKAISNSRELKEIGDEMLKNEESFKQKTSTTFDKTPNLLKSINKAQLLNLTIKDGYLTGILYDDYDFEFDLDGYLENLKLTTQNNAAWVLQQLGRITNYYVIIPFKVKL